MFNSCYYNLRNPAFLDDIGETQLRMMMPPMCGMPSDCYTGYGSNDRAYLLMNKGQPNYDNFNGKARSRKDSNIFKTILKITGLCIGAFALYKGGKKLYSFVRDKFASNAKP